MTAPLGISHKSFDAESIREAYESTHPDINTDALVDELESGTDAPRREGAIQRPARDVLRDLDAEPDWSALYRHLSEPDSIHVTGVWLLSTVFVAGEPTHRFVATVHVEYESGLPTDGRPGTDPAESAVAAVEHAWPEAEYRDTYVEDGVVMFSVRIDAAFDERHLDWLEPPDTVDDPADPRFGLPVTDTGEFTVGLLPEHAKDDIREAVSVERAEAEVEVPPEPSGPRAWGGRVTFEPVEFYLGGIGARCIVDRIAIGERSGGPAGVPGSKLVTYVTVGLETPRDAANIDTLAVDGLEVEIS